MAKEKEEKKEHPIYSSFQISEIPLFIDTYEDIFSDFDPRPFHVRALSDDFLMEAKKASRDKHSEGIIVKFIIPEEIRSLSDEALIKRRLKDHFRKHYQMLQQEHSRIKRNGIALAVLGLLMIVIGSFLETDTHSFWINLLRVLLEPGGWFLGWTGLDQLFYTVQEHRKDLSFYEKMSRSKISFHSVKQK